jgi:murein DD-endopeptidase MepM/ murein hydrolase activator NlpD
VIIVRLLFVIFFVLNLQAKENYNVYTYTKKSDGVINVYLVNNNLFDIMFLYNANYNNLFPMQDSPISGTLKSKDQQNIAKYIIGNGKYELQHNYKWVVGDKNSFHNNKYLYRLPYKLGSVHKVTQGFNGVFSHKGDSQYAVDFGMKVGTKIYASRAGIVVMIKNDGYKSGNNKKFAKDANFITIKHNDGTYGKYVHLKKGGVKVKLGQKVKRGEFLGYSGNTGYTNGPHLHFVVFKGKSYNSRKSIPIKFISKNGIVVEPIKGKSYTAVK